MRVMATRVGQYCNMLIHPGWVFTLRDDAPADAKRLIEKPEGKYEIVEGGKEGYPIREDWIPVLKPDPVTKQMVDTGEGEWKIYLDKKTKRPIHRDLALDEGTVMLKRGPIRGEVVEVGWMEITDASVTEFEDGETLDDFLKYAAPGFNPETRKLRMVHASERKDPDKSGGKAGAVRPIAKAG